MNSCLKGSPCEIDVTNPRGVHCQVGCPGELPIVVRIYLCVQKGPGLGVVTPSSDT